MVPFFGRCGPLLAVFLASLIARLRSRLCRLLRAATCLFARRALQVRRTCCKTPKARERFRKTILRYATDNKEGDEWPKWYHHCGEERNKRPDVYPPPLPHPTTKDYSRNWDDNIDPQGPIGLLVESLVWSGLVIDDNFNIWQHKEQPVSLVDNPYQSLKNSCT